MKLIPFWINAFQAYENLPGTADLSSAGELVIKFLFLNKKFKINKDNKNVGERFCWQYVKSILLKHMDLVC